MADATAQRAEQSGAKRPSAKTKLTKTAVERISLPAEGEAIVWDEDLPGFGVRVATSGRRTYFFFGRVRSSRRQVKLKIGVHGTITAERARELAKVEFGKLAADKDPAEERRAAREAEKARKEAQRARRLAPTVDGLADEYLTA
ncbi:MAG: Arm DNA-binding domain-containing protein [Stellaceae bacterium]